MTQAARLQKALDAAREAFIANPTSDNRERYTSAREAFENFAADQIRRRGSTQVISDAPSFTAKTDPSWIDLSGNWLVVVIDDFGKSKPIASASTQLKARAYAMFAFAQTAKTWGLWVAHRIEILTREKWLEKQGVETA
ncbi:MAG: hypothetical protein HOW73_20360 [Polyangiaceae bacterium]|nr:hypothetical protein [Polyangiaceae bacterium]